MKRFVYFLVHAHAFAMEEGVKRLFLAAPRQAPEPVTARAGVDTACLTLGQRAGQAAAATRLLHQLTTNGHRGTHRE